MPTRHGFDVRVRHGLERLSSADLICVPAYDPRVRQPERLTAALRASVERGARVLSICTGAFLLGDAGLLDGRRCTTHWRYTGELARRHPRAQVESDVLYVDEDPITTIARRTGLGTVDNLRHHFIRRLGITPPGYRRTFRMPHDES